MAAGEDLRRPAPFLVRHGALRHRPFAARADADRGAGTNPLRQRLALRAGEDHCAEYRRPQAGAGRFGFPARRDRARKCSRAFPAIRKMLTMRQWLGAAMLALSTPCAMAQAYPAKPVRGI